jgi:PAS domain S-box-containing protein
MNALRIDMTRPSLARHEQKAACHVFEISDDLLGSASVDGYFTSLNGAWERTLGFSREALMGQPFIEFVHPADRAATLAEVEKLAAGSDTVDFENRYARKDGGWCWLSWQAAVRAGDFYFSAHDVTAQVAAEQRRHLLTNLVEGIDDAILTKTTDGVVTSWNLAAEELYGFTAGEAIGRSMLDLIVPKDRAEEPNAIVRRLLEGDGVRQYTTQRQRKDGTMLAVSLTASLLRDDEHKVLGVAVVSRDISELSLEDSRVHDEIDTLVWVGRIRDAIDEDRIVFHAQPIVSLRGEPTSYELLCRLTGRDGELVSPARFLPVAENYGLIVELDLLAVSEAAAQIAKGHEVSINLSTATVGRRHIVDVIAERLIGAGADPSKLTLEITETALMKDIAAAQRFAAGVAQLGCRLALDDFGTGFGGFTYLKKLQIDRLKIDVEFVRDLHSSSASQHVVKAVVSLAKAFSLDTVAEGVEDEQTLTLLNDMGVSHVQGYYLARPAPISDVLEAHDEH